MRTSVRRNSSNRVSAVRFLPAVCLGRPFLLPSHILTFCAVPFSHENIYSNSATVTIHQCNINTVCHCAELPTQKLVVAFCTYLYFSSHCYGHIVHSLHKSHLLLYPVRTVDRTWSLQPLVKSLRKWRLVNCQAAAAQHKPLVCLRPPSTDL